MQNEVIETKYGSVKGIKENGVFVWKGIPYAKPPVGQLRFRRPEPPNSWMGIRDATRFGNAAPQPSRNAEIVKKDGIGIDEDCLYLNIWSSGAEGKLKPVMVWIHGGAYVAGSSSNSLYEGTSFAKKGDVVFVSINYRLGPLGFLYLSHLGGEEYQASGNCGTLDQVAALRWIQENIAAFGGDPNQVTIFGQSSGSGSVSTLMCTPQAKGLFHQAILQSWSSASTSTISEAEKVANQFLEILGIESKNFSRLTEMPAEQLVEAGACLPFVSLRPVVDGVIIPQALLEAFAGGVADDIPVMAGTTLDEYGMKAFNSPYFLQSDDELIRYISGEMRSYWPEVSSYYLNKEKTGKTIAEKMKRLMTFHMYTYSTERLVTLLANRNAPLWTYRFDWRSPVHDGALGACHGMELAFVFHTLDSAAAKERTGASPDRIQVADQMHRAWISFARNGDPNTAEVPKWNPFNLQNRPTMIFHTESRLVDDPHREERELFDKASYKLNISHTPILT